MVVSITNNVLSIKKSVTVATGSGTVEVLNFKFSADGIYLIKFTCNSENKDVTRYMYHEAVISYTSSGTVTTILTSNSTRSDNSHFVFSTNESSGYVCEVLQDATNGFDVNVAGVVKGISSGVIFDGIFPFTIQADDPNILIWFNETSIVSGGVGTNVTAWNDLQTNVTAQNLNSPNASAEPIQGTISGKATLHFDDDANQVHGTWNNSLASSTDYSVLIVAQSIQHGVMFSGDTTSSIMYGWDNSNSIYRFVASGNHDTPTGLVAGTPAFVAITSGSSSVDRYHYTTGNLLVNNSATSPVYGSDTGINFGGWVGPTSVPWQGHICEFVIYDRKLTSQEITDIWGALSVKWTL